MNCRECKNLLIEYAEGLLDGHPKDCVEQHLEQCPECRKEIENIHLLEDRILQNSLSFRSIDLEERIMDRIAGERSIRLKAASSAGFFHQIRSLFMKNAVLKIASAAAVLVFFLLIAFWNGGSPSTIVWADVQGRLNQVHTMTYSALTEIAGPAGMRITGRFKAYWKDPGLARAEEYPLDSGAGSAEAKIKVIAIIRREPGSGRMLILYPESSRAELSESVFLTDSSKPPSQSPLDFVSFNWELMKKITGDKTRRIGDRVINGIPAVGFEFEMPEWAHIKIGGQIHAQLWASANDGTLLLFELEYRDPQGQIMRAEYSDIRWNVPLDESLFDLAVPESWSLNRTRTESAEYANAGLAPGVTLQIGPDGRSPLTETEDVAKVIRGEQTTHPDSDIPPDVRVTIELKPDAMQRLRDYALANPDELLVVDFNRQIKVAANLKEADPSQLYFDLSLLDLPLAELEAKYFTTTIKRNGL
jgi:outer membrane lipoprotein-sorting protein